LNYRARRDRLVARLTEIGVEAFLITRLPNVRYLTGFSSSNAAVLVEPDRLRLFADFRYADAGRSVDGVEFVETDRALLRDLAGRLSGRIGFEAEALSYAEYGTLGADGLELVPRSRLVESLRELKATDELDAIRRAAAITNEAFARLAEERFTGRTERDLAWRLHVLLHELGAEEPAFPLIVAAGANAARPHATPSAQTIGAGQTVIVDAGCVVDGYCSDCTRTFATGPLPERLQEAYAACLAGQAAGLASIRSGVTGVAADAAAREPIAAAGFGDFFGHGLGHGVGLDVHEAPRLAPASADTLAAGQVVTVEPGIYLRGLGGVRIEDLVVVGEDGPDVLTSFPKDLVYVN
jgi:Xaa-Pro aminopeptidase